MTPQYRVYAIRYATHTGRRTPENFLFGDPHDAAGPLAYYVWLIQGDGLTVLVDLGMTAEHAARRSRTYQQSPAEGLRRLGVDPAGIAEVVITHMHWDHVGTWADFPAARFHVQDDEMRHVTGRHMAERALRHSYYVDDVEAMVRRVHADRVMFHEGDSEPFPGISLHKLGGHARGLQCVRVATRRGRMVLASDASHFYAHFQEKRFFPTFWDLNAMAQGWRRLRALADAEELIVPGHDPLVMERHPVAAPGLEGIAVRLD